MPESFLSKSVEPTREEWACYIAMTLYALHQQGFDVTKHPMHTNEHVSIGKAMLSFTNHDKDSNSRMYKRLQMLVTSKDMGELSTHLRSIIQLIKSEGIALNYALLASDLYEFQFTEQKSKVCFRWGQDFCRNIKEED
jgi:CRISPR system Cascade subunit CasB